MNQKRKILIRTSGGKAKNMELGLGHIFRTINLCNFLKKYEIHFLIEDFGGVEKIILKNGFKRIVCLGKKNNFEYDLKKTKSYIVKNQINLLIIDRYKISPKYVEELQKIVKTVIITDLKNIDFNAELVVNGFIGFKNEIKRNRFGTRCLLGPKFQIINNNLKIQKRKKKIDILATFGGFDENNLSEKFIDIITKNNFNLKVKIILGPATKITKKIKSIKKFSGLTIVKTTDDMILEISKTKYGICSGGITTYEFASCKVPFAILAQNKHQKKTAKEWEKKRIALNFGEFNKNTTKKIERYLENISTNSIKLSKKNHVDGLAIKRIVKELSKL